MFRRIPEPSVHARLVLVLCAAAGGLGALPGAGGALDPVALLAWLTLLAPAAGVLCAGARAAFFPFALAVPACWTLVLVLAQAQAVRPLPAALGADCVVFGLFAAGHALGRRARSPLRVAGLVLLGMVALACAPLGFGLFADGAVLARTHPGAARALLAASPLVVTFDCAGWDWVHAQPQVYAGSGVEWFQRSPWPATLTASVVLAVGCLLALVVPAPRPSAPPG